MGSFFLNTLVKPLSNLRVFFLGGNSSMVTAALFTILIRHVIPLFALTYSILAVELTLKWNDITDVNTIKSTGQLIPFVIGVAGLAKVLYDVYTEKQVKPLLSFFLFIPHSTPVQSHHSTHIRLL